MSLLPSEQIFSYFLDVFSPQRTVCPKKHDCTWRKLIINQYSNWYQSIVIHQRVLISRGTYRRGCPDAARFMQMFL